MQLLGRWFVQGIPRPKGSFKWIRGQAVPSSRHTAGWQATVAWESRAAWVALGRRKMIVDQRPVMLRLSFAMPQPRTKSSQRPYPSVTPDLDKLARCVFDSLTGIVYKDDGQVCRSLIEEAYTAVEKEQGVTIEVWIPDEEEPREGDACGWCGARAG